MMISKIIIIKVAQAEGSNIANEFLLKISFDITITAHISGLILLLCIFFSKLYHILEREKKAFLEIRARKKFSMCCLIMFFLGK